MTRLLIALASAFTACAATSILNPDPVHGGPCHMGDQLCTLCPDGVTPCPDGTTCGGPGECWPDNPAPGAAGPPTWKRRDAGRD